MKAQTNYILQKTKKVELIQYADRNEGESEENERKIKRKNSGIGRSETHHR